MALPVSSLRELYQHLLAPGDDGAFLQLLNEADAALLNKGKWPWTRRVVELEVEDGLAELPPQYSSILAVRVGNTPAPSHAQEYEFSDAGPGFVRPEHSGRFRLIDQGLVDAPATSPKSLDVVTGAYDSYAIFTGLTGVEAHQFVEGMQVEVSWNVEVTPDTYEEIKEDVILRFTGPVGGDFGIGFAIPGLSSGDVIASGSAVITIPSPSRRLFKVVGLDQDNPEPVTVLAQYAPSRLARDTDTPRCTNARALKLAMYAVLYENNNDLRRALTFWQGAEEALNDLANTFQGGNQHSLNIHPFGLGQSPLRCPR